MTAVCIRCGGAGAMPTPAGLMHAECFEAEREDAFVASRGFVVDSLDEWFRAGDVRRRPCPELPLRNPHRRVYVRRRR
jgi:hypothetical protein